MASPHDAHLKSEDFLFIEDCLEDRHERGFKKVSKDVPWCSLIMSKVLFPDPFDVAISDFIPFFKYKIEEG